jgi:hypothetical protein
MTSRLTNARALPSPLPPLPNSNTTGGIIAVVVLLICGGIFVMTNGEAASVLPPSAAAADADAGTTPAAFSSELDALGADSAAGGDMDIGGGGGGSAERGLSQAEVAPQAVRRCTSCPNPVKTRSLASRPVWFLQPLRLYSETPVSSLCFQTGQLVPLRRV